jgi:hypothetical protein
MALDPGIIDDLRSALVRHVRSKQRGNVTITYSELITATGRKLTQQGIGPHLTAIGDDCAANGQPRLDYLVVRETTGNPGFEVEDTAWFKQIEACRSFPWHIDG